MSTPRLAPPAHFTDQSTRERKEPEKAKQALPWAVVKPVKVMNRPEDVWWARFGQIDRTGYGGGLCQDSTHPVYLAERGEANRQGERERFFICAECSPPPKGGKR